MRFLPEHGWCIQINEREQVGSFDLCDMDSRSLTGQHYVPRTYYGRSTSPKEPVEIGQLAATSLWLFTD